MIRLPFTTTGASLLATLMFSTLAAAQQSGASGPLRVHPTNPRYFADAQGRAVYLTGSHTWTNLQDSWTDTYQPLDFDAYLDMLEANNHNFIRLWRLELPTLRYHSDEPLRHIAPHPWLRTGPGLTGDGELKFDLSKFNQAYFDRLRQRCIAAGERGMYVSVMLFDGYGVTHSIDGWFSHPFAAFNNVNGIDGDADHDGRGVEINTLDVPAVIAVQEAYVRKVIDTVNDLDNVLFEIANEALPESVAWQYHFIDFVKQYELGKPKQHALWMTTPFPNVDGELWASAAEAISPGTLSAGGAYQANPPANSGSKVIIADTDHLWGCGGSGAWVWKSFTRGLNPIYMDGYLTTSGSCVPDLDIRRQMGLTRTMSQRIRMSNAVPSGNLASTGYCLATGDAFIVYAPDGGSFSLNLAAVGGQMNTEWLNPATGQTQNGSSVSGGALRNFTPPFAGPAVLFASQSSVAPPVIRAGDLNVDGVVNVADLLIVISNWGGVGGGGEACMGCVVPGDANNDSQVNVTDLLIVITNWG